MILEIRSSIPTFKTVQFHEGLNVLLADTLPESTAKQTRNSAGKTSLIEIIHFLLGGQVQKDSLFITAPLIEHTFLGTFKIDGQLIDVARSGSSPSKIFVDMEFPNPDLPTRKDKNSRKRYVPNVAWRKFLGKAVFRLPVDETNSSTSFAPTFRSLFSYFARRRNSGAFLYTERFSDKQTRWNWQVNLSYLLGLDWEIPRDFQKVREKENTLEEIKRAAKQGTFGRVVGTVAELRPQVTIAETRAVRLRQQLENFQILDSFRELSRRAAQVKSEMQELSHEAIILQETIVHLSRAFESEIPKERQDLQRLFAALGVELPGVAIRRIEDVSSFYDSVIENRRLHLQHEITEARTKLANGDLRMAQLDEERSNIFRTLAGRGALEDFLSLQRQLADAEASAASLRERFKAAELLEGDATQLQIDRSNLKRRLQADHQQRKVTLDEAILAVADCIAELYEGRSGGFVVEATDNGPEFRISIDGDRGGGISNMEVFCLDLVLSKLAAKRLGGPRFLIHDSHLFDGVDERQIARALTLGSRTASEQTSQYIVTMNSDIFDRLPLPEDLDRTTVVLPVRLSDATDSGGLFGFRFD